MVDWATAVANLKKKMMIRTVTSMIMMSTRPVENEEMRVTVDGWWYNMTTTIIIVFITIVVLIVFIVVIMHLLPEDSTTTMTVNR